MAFAQDSFQRLRFMSQARSRKTIETCSSPDTLQHKNYVESIYGKEGPEYAHSFDFLSQAFFFVLAKATSHRPKLRRTLQPVV